MAKPTEDQIRQRAGNLGRKPPTVRRDEEFWYQAERELGSGRVAAFKAERLASYITKTRSASYCGRCRLSSRPDKFSATRSGTLAD
jgi:hypothetical protein